MNKLIDYKDTIFIAGGYGMVGKAIYKNLLDAGYGNNNFGGKILRTSREELDLTNFNILEKWFKKNKPSVVIITAAKVGGILANSEKPAEFILQNLKTEYHMRVFGITKLEVVMKDNLH